MSTNDPTDSTFPADPASTDPVTGNGGAGESGSGESVSADTSPAKAKGVNAGLFDRETGERAAAAAAAAPTARVISQSKANSPRNAAINPKLLWLLGIVAIGGLSFVVISALKGSGTDTPSTANQSASGVSGDGSPTTPKANAALADGLFVTIESDKVTISGSVNSGDAKKRLTSALATALGESFTINNATKVNTAAPTLDVAKNPVLKMLLDPVMKGVSVNGVTIKEARPPLTLAVGGVVSTELARDRIMGAAAGAAGGVDKVDDQIKIDPTLAGEDAGAPASVQAELDKVLSGRVVEFQSGSATLTSEWVRTVDEVATALKGNDTTVQIVGHTDDEGDAETNDALSLERAETIKKALVSKGIAASRITTAGFGSTKPLDSNLTTEGRQRNRRIEFVIAAN